MRWLELPTPLGPLVLVATPRGLCRLDFGTAEELGLPPPAEARAAPWGDPAFRILREAAVQLQEYLAGRRRAFALPLDLEGTPFQLRVWAVLQRIPYGQTRTYGWVAAEAGSPGAARAVGGACARNPVAIVVPCHRVVAAGGLLGGYSGGPERKQHLLRLEGILS